MKKMVFTSLLLAIGVVSYCQNLKTDLDSLLNKHINEGQLHGCVTYVQQGDKILHFQSYGLQSIEKNKKMENDVIFRLASMSKMLTAVGALKLYEDGKFLLDEPVKKYLPQLANLKVKQKNKADSTILADLSRDITIRDLMRCTAGFGDYVSTDFGKTPDEFLEILSKNPLKYQPGGRWVYSGIELKVLGILIEKITNKNLHDYLTEAIFKPLKMTNSGFFVTENKVNKFSSFYSYGSDGKLKLAEKELFDFYKLSEVRNGSAGLVSSANDLANFYNMILHYGMFNGKQILRPQTIELLISNQIAAINDRGWAVAGFGFGVGVNQGRLPVFINFLANDSVNNNGRTKSIYWQGSPYNTRFFIDFEKQIIAIFLTQNAPFTHLDLMKKFDAIVNENLD